MSPITGTTSLIVSHSGALCLQRHKRIKVGYSLLIQCLDLILGILSVSCSQLLEKEQTIAEIQDALDASNERAAALSQALHREEEKNLDRLIEKYHGIEGHFIRDGLVIHTDEKSGDHFQGNVLIDSKSPVLGTDKNGTFLSGEEVDLTEAGLVVTGFGMARSKDGDQSLVSNSPNAKATFVFDSGHFSVESELGSAIKIPLSRKD